MYNDSQIATCLVLTTPKSMPFSIKGQLSMFCVVSLQVCYL